MKTPQFCLSLLGPTASGKSQFALDLARDLNGEILCLDSTTVYREFNIGSAKPSPSDQRAVPHHLLDILEPTEEFSAGDFVDRAEKALTEVHARGKLPILVGGTYFYLRALQHGMFPTGKIDAAVVEAIEQEFAADPETGESRLHEALSQVDPESAQKIHPNDRYRLVRALAHFRTSGEKLSSLKAVPKSEAARARLWLKYAILIPRHQLGQRIVERTDKMILQGLVEETRRLRESYPTARALGSVGYAEAVRHLDGQLDQTQLRNEVIEKTRQLAKRQMTWLRSDPEVRFIDGDDRERVLLEVSNLRAVLNPAPSA